MLSNQSSGIPALMTAYILVNMHTQKMLFFLFFYFYFAFYWTWTLVKSIS